MELLKPGRSHVPAGCSVGEQRVPEHCSHPDIAYASTHQLGHAPPWQLNSMSNAVCFVLYRSDCFLDNTRAATLCSTQVCGVLSEAIASGPAEEILYTGRQERNVKNLVQDA